MRLIRYDSDFLCHSALSHAGVAGNMIYWALQMDQLASHWLQHLLLWYSKAIDIL